MNKIYLTKDQKKRFLQLVESSDELRDIVKYEDCTYTSAKQLNTLIYKKFGVRNRLELVFNYYNNKFPEGYNVKNKWDEFKTIQSNGN